MDYFFENLGDERFQELCNTIITKEFIDVQSLPVGQPDGGRDALSYYMNSSKKSFNVYQVKFVRNPNNIADPHKWLFEILKGEIPKIKNLIPRGAVKYYILTNVKGTSHLDGGSIDKVNKLLEENISIPSLCWWRDDLSRLIEKDPLFKWSFPEILNAQDFMNSALFSQIHENRERREQILRAYLADQYSIDNEVKFKQIDLHNKLFNLFTDVPIKVKKLNVKNKSLRKTLQYFEGNLFRRAVSIDEYLYYDNPETIGAAKFLLHSRIQNEIERILLEGGPGQGKSTISQYISQVHRARLLNKSEDLKFIPEDILQSSIRLPFKIDLRDIASWIERKNPYEADLNNSFFESNWKNSLESFLVSHIIYHSKITEFNTSDLSAIIKQSSILLVFDGFDEIANLSVRKDVVEFINKGINRISENAKSIQVLITSRPAAFSDTIGFEVDLYPHFELTDITTQIIEEYLEKWIKASNLTPREAKDIKKLLKDKLELPHLKELTKSPMQLAIFISLLRTRGESLPNKRTALYDSYIELFFNRESEKNTIIRDYRDLIIDIHQYLAWILHSEAEYLKNSGSISFDNLIKRLKLYLEEEGHKTDIADKLFNVVKERVCALISRVQGTFEFEIQPLREYFCAKYLYETSPYSPPGREKPGTKPERFDAIARSFYWQNVVRFFAGCFDKGELPMLIEKLNELQDDKYLQYTNYPRVLTSQILFDHVFTQYPSLLKKVVEIILNGMGGLVIDAPSSNDAIILPDNSGRIELVTECFKQLAMMPKKDYAIELIEIINNNPLDKYRLWAEKISSFKNDDLTNWFEYGYQLQLTHIIDKEHVINILEESKDINTKYKRLQTLINGNGLENVLNDFNLKEQVLEGILDGKIFVTNRKSGYTVLSQLGEILNPYLLGNLFNSDFNGSFKEYVILYLHHKVDPPETNIVDSLDRKVNNFIKQIDSALNSSTKEFCSSTEPWDLIIESLRDSFGERWNFNVLAVISAGIKSRNDSLSDFANLQDNSKSLVKRIRYARLKSGNIKFWQEVFKDENIKLSLLIFFSWATDRTIFLLSNDSSNLLKNLSDDDYMDLVSAVQKVNNSGKTNSQILLSLLKNNSLSNEFKFMICLRFNDDRSKKFISEYVNLDSPKLSNYKIIKLDNIISVFLKKPNLDLLDEIEKVYALSDRFSNRHLRSRHYHYESKEILIPLEIAEKVMKNPKVYPRIISIICEKTCRLNANKHIKHVGKVAKSNKWFVE
ncbi:NACHT domain-containing protein [Flavobacterium beibuense]|uniref:NTPase (NACHT family)-like protein n=1 Tax=Flavobacterium beibuense TaxID=657326 RepID=A0A444WBR4_9FLAO|nr:NTPase (NACHT family)-like protein [Flavobacterium beibuense]RYJ43277.1 NTPase (NACHT family)-like protein [Flavobacterium beibuense]